jgi:hypothetical protein
MPRALLDVAYDVGEPAMDSPAPLGADGAVGLGGEQRMREPDAVAVELGELEQQRGWAVQPLHVVDRN